MTTTRRGLLKRTAGVGLAAAGAGAITRAATAEAALIPPYNSVWAQNPVPVISRSTQVTNDDEQALWATLMQVNNKISGALAPWYLWFWTHDSAVMRLYTTQSLSNPQWVEQAPCTTPRPGPPYQGIHWSSGDVVWDPATQFFYSIPHSRYENGAAGKDNSHQDTFIIRSRNGRNWEWLPSVGANPIIRHRPGFFDGRCATYGRFMRDINGNVARHGGQLAIFYRGEFWQGEDPNQKRYKHGVATASVFQGPWSRGSEATFVPLDASQVITGLGSAVYSGGTVHLAYTLGQIAWRKPGVANNPFALMPNDPGTPLFLQTELIADGPSIVADGANQQYAVNAGYFGAPVDGAGNAGIFMANGVG